METLMKMKWKIGSVEIENPFILAPMAGVTDLPFRILCKEQGAGLLCTEMVSAKAISFHNKNTISLMQIDPVEHPVSMQIFGSEPDLMAEVAKSIEEQPFDILDINMGCPVPKVVNNGEGSALLKNPELIREIVDAGHTVGNHTMTHPDMSGISTKEAFQKQLEDVEVLYKEATGKEMTKFYRPPQGIYSVENLEMAKEMGYHTFFWSLAYVDWYQDKQPSKEEAFEKLLGRIHPGAIVLLHSTSSTNASILDELLTKWEEIGYTFGTLEELVASGSA